jgi:hypothetical protein
VLHSTGEEVRAQGWMDDFKSEAYLETKESIFLFDESQLCDLGKGIRQRRGFKVYLSAL